jgi:hypothetical protein
MTRYVFNIRDGEDIPDTIGSEYPALASLRQEALEATTDIIKGRLLTNSDSEAWIVQVTDEAGFTVMVLSFSASIHATHRTAEPVAA